MRSIWFKAARAAFAAMLIAAAAALVLRVGNGVEPGMLALMDSAFDQDLQAAAATAAGSARVVVAGTNWADVARGADIVRETFGMKSPARSILADLRGRTAGLIDPATRALLASNDFAAVRGAAEARLFGIAPPLFSVKDDPMLLATEYVEGLHGAMAPGWTFRDGLPAKSANGKVYAIVQISSLPEGPRFNAGRCPQCIANGRDARCPSAVANGRDARCPSELPKRMPPGVSLHFSGALFHSARSASGAKREIGILSAVSLALAILLGWMLFRSMSFALPLAAALCSGVLVAAGALFAVYPRPHLLTFVFGTSLIGLSVDYVYHARAAGGARNVLRPLTQSFATTLVCFAPLLFADVMVLRQMALFAAAGLSAVYAGVVGGFAAGWGQPALPERGALGATRPTGASGEARPSRHGISAIAHSARLVLLVAATCGAFRIRTSSDPSEFYRPDSALAADERIAAELLSMNGSKIAFTRGATLQEALEREEEAGIGNGLSRIVPSLKRQRENRELVGRLYAAEGGRYENSTGINVRGACSGLLDPEDIPPGSALGAIMATMWTGRGLIAPCFEGSATACPPGDSRHTSVIDLRETMQGVFKQAADSTWRLFAISSVALLAFLALVFRRRAFIFIAPPASALAATAGILGWMGVPLTFFTLLSLFVVLGLGLDYAIFHRSDSAAAATQRTVFFAFLTSLAGLGLLAFTEFPVTRDMGITFAIGLSLSYICSLPHRRIVGQKW